jgi:hypothetical protein
MSGRRVGRLQAVDAPSCTPAPVSPTLVTEAGHRGGRCMAVRLPGRLPGWARLVVLIAVWVALYVSLVDRLWPVVGVVGVAAVIWLFWLERGATPRRTIAEAILRTAFWAIVSLIGFLALVFVLLFLATVGAGIGLWGSPWDGR